MIDTHVLNKGGRGVTSPLDRMDRPAQGSGSWDRLRNG
jgi:hypothetical protein